MSLHPFITIKELQLLLAKNEVTPSETLDFFSRRFQVYDQDLGSALEVFDKASILQESYHDGSLKGIPGLIKNNICIKGRKTTCASRILADYHAAYDATAIERLKHEGALMLGSANMDEFAMGSSTETSAFKKTKNPWDVTRVPGGSSGGSAAAVAAGLVPWALGTDTGGSVRQPAALCGIYGYKPTYGLVSRYGLVAYGSSLDQIGIFARTAYDTAAILSVMAGQDMRDSSSLAVEKKDYTHALTGELPKGLRIGVVKNALYADGMDPEILAAIEASIKVFERKGAIITHFDLPTMDYSAAAYFILSRAEAASNLARFDGVRYGYRNNSAHSLNKMYEKTRHDGFGSEVRKRIIVGNYVLSASHSGEYYENAKKVQRLMRKEFLEAFKSVDLLIIPTHPMSAFKFGAFDVNPLQMDLQDYFTCPMNITGVPAVSIPCGMTSEGLPIGFQIVGSHLADERILQVAHAYEQETEWHKLHPKGF